MADKSSTERPSARSPVAPLPFGIPQLDTILGYRYGWGKCGTGKHGERDQEAALDRIDACLGSATSLAIVGPDGAGKSVFALHVAAAYASAVQWRQIQNNEDSSIKPKIVYLSSDLGFASGNGIWGNFGLEFPWLRYTPFISDEEVKFRTELRDMWMAEKLELEALCVKLCRCVVGSSSGGDAAEMSIDQFLAKGATRGSEIGFVDLRSDTAGDDWLFATRMVAATRKVADAASPNLLVVDSVEGFEALVGDRDSFGETTSRRARIAQLLRAAGEDWHLVFVVEEPKDGTHHPEEYVTDTVLHLRRRDQSAQARRTLEIEKCRGRAFGDGEHPFSLRSGKGTSTGEWENPDDPFLLPHRAFRDRAFMDDKYLPHSYVQVFPLLSYLSRDFARSVRFETKDRKEATSRVASFGILGLDEMLVRESSEAALAMKPADAKRSAATGPDCWLGTPLAAARGGLPQSSVTLLVGEAGTRKEKLAEEFLHSAFVSFDSVFTSCVNAIEAGLKGRPEDRLGVLSTELRSTLDEGRMNVLKVIDPSFTSPVGMPTTRLSKFKEKMSAASVPKLSLDLPKKLKGDGASPRRVRWIEDEFWDSDRGYHYDASEQPIALALALLRLPSNLVNPVIWVTTRDESAQELAKRVLERIIARADGRGGCSTIASLRRDSAALVRVHLEWLIASKITVRRIDNVDMSAAELWHVVERCVQHALEGIGADRGTLYSGDLVDGAGGIRLVLSDLSTIRSAFPDVARDPLFLSTLAFRLRRVGITVLLVETANGRPDAPMAERSSDVAAYVDRQILTWKVPFFGEEKVAIAVTPASGGPGANAIRELANDVDTGGGRPELKVDSHFEGYSGVERGEPRQVPLVVSLLRDSPVVDEYAAMEDAMLARRFTCRPGTKSVIEVLTPADYGALQTFCGLPTGARLDYAHLIAVEGFWPLGKRAALRDCKEYLFAPLTEQNDPLGLWHMEDSGGEPGAQSKSESEVGEDRKGAPAQTSKCRGEMFEHVIGKSELRLHYRARMPLGTNIDRVPYFWDFGFLVLDRRAWDRHGHLSVDPKKPRGRGSHDSRTETEPMPTVGKIFERMTRLQMNKIGDPRRDLKIEKLGEGKVSWREFLGACLAIAREERARTSSEFPGLEIAAANPESISCLVFEIWFSEIAKLVKRGDSGERAARAKTLLQTFSKEYHRDPGDLPELTFNKEAKFVELLKDGDEGFVPELYLAGLLIFEVLDFKRYLRSDWPSLLATEYSPAREASAVRHWYSTACAEARVNRERVASGGEGAEYVFARLPGHFCSRRDWFLGVVEGSRSVRIGYEALDLLTARRANKVRLEMGIGLPVRDQVNDGATVGSMRTGLFVQDGGRSKYVSYQDLAALGGQFGLAAVKEESMIASDTDGDLFLWHFRTGFEDYHRYAPTFQAWLARTFAWVARRRTGSASTAGAWFDEYDSFEGVLKSRGDLGHYVHFQEFAKRVSALRSEMSSIASRHGRVGGGV